MMQFHKEAIEVERPILDILLVLGQKELIDNSNALGLKVIIDSFGLYFKNSKQYKLCQKNVISI